MPNINRIITLTAQGNNSGPLYDIYYSENCVSYSLAIDGDNVSLPSIGSTAIITLPDTAICIKLVNLSEGCLLNEVIQYIGPNTTTTTTSTTSTTTSTTSTTSTTTAAPTTTTTTQCACVETVTLDVTEAGNVQFTDCFGVVRLTSVGTGIQTLDYTSDGCININTISGTATFTIDAYGPCCTPTSTTTTSTTSTTTTTAAPTTTTTTYRTTYLVEPCGGGLGPFIVTRTSGDIPAGIGQAFKISGNTPAGFNGTTCWEILEIDPVGTIDYNNLAFGTVFSNCAACLPTTTTTSTTSTTTTTAAPTTTTTTYITTYKVEPCGGGVGPYIVTRGSGDIPAGIGQAFKISGNTPAGFNGITCWEVLEIDPVGTIDYNNLAFGTVFSNCAACLPTTTTTTSTTTTSTSTTTTLAPVNGTISATCNTISYGDTPTATVSITALTGGSGVYQVTNVLYLTEAGALAGTYIDAGTLPINYFSVENNTWWVGIRDKNNTANKVAKQIVVNCPEATTTTTTAAPTTTTTSTTSTTTTTAAPTKYKVELCGGGEGPFIITRASGDTPSGIGQSFKLNKTSTPFNGIKCWEVLEIDPAGAVDYSDVAFGTVFSNCLACNPTTTTTSTTSTTSTTTSTTTAAPTTTTTTVAGNYVTNVFGSASDVLGEIYIDASVTLNTTVTTDTSFDVIVSTVPYGDTTVVVVITNGNNIANGSTYVGMGSLPSSYLGQCISSCDDPGIVLTGFEC